MPKAPKRPKCTALYLNGEVCQAPSDQSIQKLCICTFHHREYKRVNREYKAAHNAFDNISITLADRRHSYTGEALTEFKLRKQKLAQKIAEGRKAATLRAEVNHRFFNMHAAEENRTHIQEILKLEFELKELEPILADLESREKSIKQIEEMIRLEEQAMQRATQRVTQQVTQRAMQQATQQAQDTFRGQNDRLSESYRRLLIENGNIRRSHEELEEKLKSVYHKIWISIVIGCAGIWGVYSFIRRYLQAK